MSAWDSVKLKLLFHVNMTYLDLFNVHHIFSFVSPTHLHLLQSELHNFHIAYFVELVKTTPLGFST